jgi:multidrug efflux system outer membrane protein
MSSPMRTNPMRSRLVSILAFICAPLAACAVGPNFKPPAPDAPAAWSSTTAGGQASQVVSAPADPGAWWAGFNDVELSSLVARAKAANLDAREAVLRIAEARAQRDVTGAAGLPSLNANASYQSTRLSESTPTGGLFSQIGKFPGLSGVSIPNPYDQYQLGFDASWEIDLFGRVRRSVEAADADTAASVEDSRAVQVSMLGDVGRAYVDLRGAQLKRQITQQNIATDQELLSLAGQRRTAGLASEVDVASAAAQALASQAQLPALDRQITSDINQLSKLLALPPGALRAELDNAQAIPPVPPVVPVGLPADLARRRPDIREAEARLHGATARVGVAVADLYPRLTLSAQGGYQAERPAQLLDWASRFLVAGPQLELPIFDAGRRRATVRLQNVREQEAAMDYRRTVLSALDDVDNALAAYAADQSRESLLEQTVKRNNDVLGLARQRYAAGVASYITVLDADRTVQQNQMLLADSQAAVSSDLVALYRALGGGWEVGGAT